MNFGEEFIELTAEWDRWPTSVSWSADGSALIVTADDNGRGPIFAVDANTLYPLLRRLEKQGLLTSDWNTDESRPRIVAGQSSIDPRLSVATWGSSSNDGVMT